MFCLLLFSFLLLDKPIRTIKDRNVNSDYTHALFSYMRYPPVRFIFDWFDRTWEIIDDISKHDEVEFVIGDKNDFEWALNKIKTYNLEEKCSILFSSVFDKIEYQKVVEWILNSNINARFQLQIHKHIWKKEKRGV